MVKIGAAGRTRTRSVTVIAFLADTPPVVAAVSRSPDASAVGSCRVGPLNLHGPLSSTPGSAGEGME